jgi:DNA-binding NtrC family response regulator
MTSRPILTEYGARGIAPSERPGPSTPQHALSPRRAPLEDPRLNGRAESSPPASHVTNWASLARQLVQPTFVARSAAMSEMLEMAAIFARLRAPILIEGATGTGKMYVAHFIHLMSPRRDATFTTVHGAALDDSLAGSDLFGHAQGAFTGASRLRDGLLASANGGSVFLDEIGKMQRFVQGKLLHVIEGRPFHALGEDRPRSVDVRFIAAASEGLERLVETGVLLGDLYQRLKGFRIVVPSLRERREDIPGLVDQFAHVGAVEAGYFNGPPIFDGCLMRALTRASWPGNLRELANTVLQLMCFAQGQRKVTLEHCRGGLKYLVDVARVGRRPNSREVEEMVERSSGNRSEAARLLGVSRSTIQRRLRQMRIPAGLSGRREEALGGV